MIVRTEHFWRVALFLARFGHEQDGKTTPPEELSVTRWNLAYRMFYEGIGSGRTIDAFELSLRNARDAYDSHIPDNIRVGWLDSHGNPEKLNTIANDIFNKHANTHRSSFWEQISHLADGMLPSYNKVVDDLSSIQNMELDGSRQSLTEGGMKVIISVRYERNIRLRNLAFEFHGYDCSVCGFNFEKAYGSWGKGFAEVHHLEPISHSGGQKKSVNVKTDLIVLCANCHRMAHRKKGLTLTVDELKNKMSSLQAWV